MDRPSKTQLFTTMAMNQETEQGHDIAETTFNRTTDVCDQLLHRYSASTAPQHRHLLATAAALRSILSDNSLPLTPSAYFAAAISNLSEALDPEALSAIASFMAIVLPMIPPGGIGAGKAGDASLVLVEVIGRESERMSASSMRAVVKSLGVLLNFCELSDWKSIKPGFETILKFSIDKRPKVRKCAQDFLQKLFTCFHSSVVLKKASKMVLSLFRTYIPLAVHLSSMQSDNSEVEILSRSEHLDVLHMLNVLKLILPSLSVKISSAICSELQKLMTSQFSVLTRHVHNLIEALVEASKFELSILELEKIYNSLALYASLYEKNPCDTLISASSLLKRIFDMISIKDPSLSIRNLPLAVDSLAGLLNSEASTASRASFILKELINQHMDVRCFLDNKNQICEDEERTSIEISAIEKIFASFENALNASDGNPNEHVLAVISVLFVKLGEASFNFMKGILLKLADILTLYGGDMPSINPVYTCIGSAVIVVGPEKMLALFPISVDVNNFMYSNIWLLPILKNYIVGAPLKYYMEHIIPLAELFQQASRKAKKAVIREDLQACAYGLWGLLPAFCRHPCDTYQQFGSLVRFMVASLKKDTRMHENVIIALKALVNQNRTALGLKLGDGESDTTFGIKDTTVEIRSTLSYPKKTASRNIKALALCSNEILETLIDIFFNSPPEKRKYLKDGIECLASVTSSTIIQQIFVSSLEKFQLINGMDGFDNLASPTHICRAQEEDTSSAKSKDTQRCMVTELASSLVVGANEDLVGLIFNFIRHSFQEANEIGQCEAYHALGRVLEEQSWFCSLRLGEVINLIFSMRASADTALLRKRFACFQKLMIYIIEEGLDEDDEKALLILSEIILTLKDAKEEGRKVAHDTLIMISSRLKRSSHSISGAPYPRLISMITAYLSASSPHMKSGAISALSLLVYKDADICLSVPSLIPSVLALFESKTTEVIKAALGFVKVLVLCLQAQDLQNFLSDILDSIIRWSSVSRNHFKSKVAVILEIVTRKCGSATVKAITPVKYKGFVKNVLENRRGKTNSEEAGGVGIEPKFDNSYSNREQKREPKKPDPENGLAESRKRKRFVSFKPNESDKATSTYRNEKPARTASRFGDKLGRCRSSKQSSRESSDNGKKKKKNKRMMKTTDAARLNRHKKPTPKVRKFNG